MVFTKKHKLSPSIKHQRIRLPELFGKWLYKENVDFDSKSQHLRYRPHVLNLGVQDILKLVDVEVDVNIDITTALSYGDLVSD